MWCKYRQLIMVKFVDKLKKHLKPRTSTVKKILIHKFSFKQYADGDYWVSHHTHLILPELRKTTLIFILEQLPPSVPVKINIDIRSVRNSKRALSSILYKDKQHFLTTLKKDFFEWLERYNPDEIVSYSIDFVWLPVFDTKWQIHKKLFEKKLRKYLYFKR